MVQKHDILMYDLKNGKLMGLHNKIFEVQENDDVHDRPIITKFCIDKKHRKAYIANNFG